MNQQKYKQTPTKTDQCRKSKVSPFKGVDNQNTSRKKTELHASKIEGETGCGQASPEQCSQITAELRYLYERQKKMVAQLSQNKIGRSFQPQQQVPGLSLQTINEHILPSQLNAAKSSQTPKQQLNMLTPSATKSNPFGFQVEPKTVRGNIGPNYQTLLSKEQIKSQQEQNQVSCLLSSQNKLAMVGHQQIQHCNNFNQIESCNATNQNKQSVNQGRTRKNQNNIQNIAEHVEFDGQNSSSLRLQNYGAVMGTHRNFISENKKLSSQVTDKGNNLYPQNTQSRAAVSHGKPNHKQSSKDKYKLDVRPTHINNQKATPKKYLEKKEYQKIKTRNDFSKTQYLSKKQPAQPQTRKAMNQPQFNQFIGSLIKSPSNRGQMATQMTDSLRNSKIVDSLLNNHEFKQFQENQDNTCKTNLQQYIKNKDKLNRNLNMTINISSSNRQESNSTLNTQRVLKKSIKGDQNQQDSQIQIGINKSQHRYMQTQPEEINESCLQHSIVNKGQEITDYLRTLQSGQLVNQNHQTLTFANQANLDLASNQIRNPTFQQQSESSNQNAKPVCQNLQVECTQVEVTNQSSECMGQPNYINKPATQIHCHNQLRPEQSNQNLQACNNNAQIHNRDSNNYINELSSQIKNVLILQDQKQDYNNKSSTEILQQNIQSPPKQFGAQPQHFEDQCCQLNQNANNVVSFQQNKDKIQKSLEQRSPIKKYNQKCEKENIEAKLQKHLNFKGEDEINQKQDQLAINGQINVQKGDIRAMEPVKSNTQSETNEIKQGKHLERPVLSAQSLNRKQPERKTQEKLDEVELRRNIQASNNHASQVNAGQSANDTMCFSQKTSLDEYVIGKQIGQGAYAVVRIGLHKPTNRKVALKIYKKFKLEEPNRRKSVKREIKLMDKMKHNSIVQLYEIIDTSKYVILVMEYVGGSSLHGYLKSKSKRRLEEWDAKRIFKQIIEGLKYCHSRCITHRDIKLENLLLDENNKIKIIDFGFSTCIPNEKKIKIFCGTPSYMAPEIVMKTEYCGPPADIWAMGVLLFTILSGQFPYRGATDEELYDKICRADYHLPKEVKDSLSPASKDLLAKLFQLNPDNRPTARQILEHQWLYNVDKKDNSQAQNQNDSVSQIKSTDYLQLQKRAKSQRLDYMAAPRNKNQLTANPVERQVAINPFNITQTDTEYLANQNKVEIDRSMVMTDQSENRSNSHFPKKAIAKPIWELVKLISDEIGYDPEFVQFEVKNYLLSQANNQNSFATKSNAAIIGKIYERLLYEDYKDKQIEILKQFKYNQKVKSETSISEQVNIFMGSEGKSQPKSDNGYFSQNMANMTQHLLMKSAISQTSLGVSAVGANITSQGFGQGNAQQNLGVQPSMIPSMKSLYSGSASGNVPNDQTGQNSQFNNTINPSTNANAAVYQTNMVSPINFNHTQPLKGILDNLNETTTSYSGVQQQMISSPSTQREQTQPLNFTQTNIFVTNNNQLFGDMDCPKQQTHNSRDHKSKQTFKQSSELLPQERMHWVTAQQTQNSQLNNQYSYGLIQQCEQAQIKDSTIASLQTNHSKNMLVNNFFRDQPDNSYQNQPEEQESPNFRQRPQSDFKY